MLPIENLKAPEVRKIGVFDSGLGGLTVLQELLRNHPGHEYVYFGDTAHVPYGSRHAEDVIELVTEIAGYLVEQGCQGLILACNTSSALAISALRTAVDVPVLGVIGAAAREAAEVTGGCVAVLANPLTASSGVYGERIRMESKGLAKAAPRVVEIGCPDLVPIVEKGLLHTEESKQILDGYARTVLEAGADTLVLGCTHYPLLLPVLGPLLGDGVRIVNPATLMSEYLRRIEQQGTVEYKVSGCPEEFSASASRILGWDIETDQVLLRRPTQTL